MSGETHGAAREGSHSGKSYWEETESKVGQTDGYEPPVHESALKTQTSMVTNKRHSVWGWGGEKVRDLDIG